MSLFDGDKNPWNLRMKTMGGKVFWEKIDSRGEYVLQQHKFTRHCRILDGENNRVAWGEEGPMRARLEALFPEWTKLHAHYGDVIGVHRLGGIFDHYGIYENDYCIYEYSKRSGELCVNKTTLREFVGDEDSYFVLVFPEEYGKPGKYDIAVAGPQKSQAKYDGVVGYVPFMTSALEKLIKAPEYKLYSGLETVRRAKSRMGEAKYNLLFRNCEHFALWCKTGISESHQAERLFPKQHY